MSKFGTIITILTIIMGILLIMFVLKIIFLSSNSMGMMMDRDMIFDHLLVWLKAIMIITIIIVLLIWIKK